ncbi:hypothetical protein FRC17_001534 [Serendipita sp. 399]|nr:hypothetical protein FRC17_001534 [Serendipita sp. 399]
MESFGHSPDTSQNHNKGHGLQEKPINPFFRFLVPAPTPRSAMHVVENVLMDLFFSSHVLNPERIPSSLTGLSLYSLVQISAITTSAKGDADANLVMAMTGLWYTLPHEEQSEWKLLASLLNPFCDFAHSLPFELTFTPGFCASARRLLEKICEAFINIGTIAPVHSAPGNVSSSQH